jgi:hypothetical protein
MKALEALRYDWGSAYEIEHDGDEWRAARLDGLGGWMHADSADDLRTQIFSDYATKPVCQQGAKAPTGDTACPTRPPTPRPRPSPPAPAWDPPPGRPASYSDPSPPPLAPHAAPSTPP